MRCEWCTAREATCAGKPHVGPWSLMCDPCKQRVCRKDEQGFETMSIEDYQKMMHPGKE